MIKVQCVPPCKPNTKTALAVPECFKSFNVLTQPGDCPTRLVSGLNLEGTQP